MTEEEKAAEEYARTPANDIGMRADTPLDERQYILRKQRFLDGVKWCKKHVLEKAEDRIQDVVDDQPTFPFILIEDLEKICK